MSSPRRVPALTLMRLRTASNSVSLSTPRLLSLRIRGSKACRPGRFSKLIMYKFPLAHRVVETSISDPGRHSCRLADDDADGSVEVAVAAKPQVKRGLVGRSEPARPFATEQRLIKANQRSCTCTLPTHAIQACSSVVSHQRLPHTALVLLKQYPYRLRPTLPTHMHSIRQVLSNCRANADGFGGEMSQRADFLHSQPALQHMQNRRTERGCSSTTAFRYALWVLHWVW
jgi:hypothetical protein